MDNELPDISYGWCVDCDKYVGDAMAVAYAQGNSGPGKVLHACIAHAREYAALWFAPQWLKDDIAALDTAHSPHADAPAQESA
ncbi:hypothetical protein DEH18_33535 [Streptomyces sp. NHF165]|uniref:hypothetical protein n=1 Tax=Streptomyces sp. NHF165 TaxID=2175864 RepID=UPI00132F2682|nr:hypothetical protein [Streptomyces sp. NHF165]QHF97949.1 hypothetical protein DEH18_33535 [Streptomyces sp. NHF165]